MPYKNFLLSGERVNWSNTAEPPKVSAQFADLCKVDAETDYAESAFETFADSVVREQQLKKTAQPAGDLQLAKVIGLDDLDTTTDAPLAKRESRPRASSPDKICLREELVDGVRMVIGYDAAGVECYSKIL